MGGGGQEGEPPEDARSAASIAERYLAAAAGDARVALVRAVADGIAVSALVSRGFARWGPSASGRGRAKPQRIR